MMTFSGNERGRFYLLFLDEKNDLDLTRVC